MKQRTVRILLALIAYSLATKAYFLLRYGGYWIENDTATMTRFIQASLTEQTIFPKTAVYPFGFGYPTWFIFASQLTGLDVYALQLWILPLIAAPILVLLLYGLFRRFLGDSRAVPIAVFLILVSPDFILTSARGSHEKFTYIYVLFALLGMLIFYQSRSLSDRFGALALVYTSFLAFSTTNTFFASAFAITLFWGFVIGYFLLVRRMRIGEAKHVKGLVYTSIIGLAIVYLVLFHFYPPSRFALQTFSSTTDKLTALLLGRESPQFPYSYIQVSWTPPFVWVILSSSLWLVLPLSAISWIRGLRSLATTKMAHSGFRGATLLLSLYTAFFVQLVAFVILDVAFTAGGNLQVRFFPVALFLAAPLAARFINEQSRRSKLFLRYKRLATIVVLILAFTAAGLLKATSDPLVSNQWLFFSPAERAGIGWVEFHSTGAVIWADYTDRLGLVYVMYFGIEKKVSNTYVTNPLNSSVNLALVSDIIETRHFKLDQPLPQTDDSSRVYDAGTVRIYLMPS